MNILRKFPQRLIYVLSVAALVMAPGLLPVQAKDTDIYLLAPSTSTDDKPNVLIILDNSGSMSEQIATAQVAYDASVDYCDSSQVNAVVSGAAGGIPGSCTSISGRIYWAFPDNSGNAEPPGMSSDQWFTATKNKCLKSLDPNAFLSVSGKYSGDKIARWYGSGSTSNRGWKTLNNKTNGTITHVDCEDDGTVDGQTAGDNTFPQNSTSTAYASSNAFSWSGFNNNSSPTLYTANYMAYWHNNLLVASRSRMDIAKDAVKSLIDTYTGVRFGLMAFNANNSTPHGGRVLFRVANMDNTRRTAMKNVVDSLTAETYTPLSETLWEAYRYLAGLGATYGNPTTQTPHQDSCAQNTSDTACNNGGYYDAIAAGNPSYNDGSYVTPYTYGCQKSFIIYVTDGDPFGDGDADASIETLIGSSCDGTSCLDDLAGYMYNNDIVNPGLPDAQTVRTYTIALGTGISTAGQTLLNSAASEGGGQYLTAVDGAELTTALAQVVNQAMEFNTSFSAPSLSVNAFNRLYNRDDIYFALFNPTSSQGWDGNLKKYRLCSSSDVTTYGCTFGEIIDVNNVSAIDTTIDPATGKAPNKIYDTAVSYWGTTQDGPDVNLGGAGTKITSNAVVPRALYTYRGSYSGLSSSSPATPVAIAATTGNSVYDAAVTDPTILGLPSGTTVTASSDKVAQLINWMRGRDAYDDDGDCATGLDLTDPANASNSCVTESRPWNFADPLHSRPVAFTYGAELTSGNPDPTKPVIKLFIGTNDGMIRIINNSTGVEEWAFMPKEMLSKQFALSENNPGDHVYGLDDSPAFLVNDLDNDGIIEPAAGDKVYMFIGMRRGGRNIYAFDATPAAVIDEQSDTVAPRLIWTIEGGSGDFVQLGQTWSRPKVARIRAKCTPSAVCDDGDPATNDSESRMVLIIGGGYDTNQDNDSPGTDSMGNAIYIVDPFTGARIWWASNATGASLVLDKMEFSIPSEITAVDTNSDKSVDRLYVGDAGGQLWRIDLGDQIGGTGSGGSSGYVFADAGCDSTSATQRVHDAAGACPAGTTDQGRRKFFYPPDVAMVKDTAYSTNANYDLVTIGSGNREDPLDLLTSSPSADYPVHNRIYAFRDYDYSTGAPTTTPTTPVSDYNMYDATVNTIGSLSQTDINNNVKGSKGWYFNLVEPSAVTLLNGLSSTWAGEKVLAKTLVFDGVLYFTTFVPANQNSVSAACTPNEGEARAYAVNYLTGDAVYDQDGDNTPDRFAVIGGGIPSEVVIVIRDGGVTGLVGTSGGAAGVTVGGSLPRYKTYWYDE